MPRLQAKCLAFDENAVSVLFASTYELSDPV
jgi:hypothetical protein